jgi:chemotaxis protein MotA
LSAVIFLIASLGLVLLAAMLGGSPAAFWSASSFALVAVGTFTVTAIGCDVQDGRALIKRFPQLWTTRGTESSRLLRTLLDLGARVRRDGPIALENAKLGLRFEPFLERAVSLAAEGHNADIIERILTEEATIQTRQLHRLANILYRAGDISPAMGLIGTLIGLVQMMGQLSSPDKLGPAMALALLTTLYGAVIAHIWCLPLASRALARAESQQDIFKLCAAGVASLCHRDHPLVMEQKLRGYVDAVRAAESA